MKYVMFTNDKTGLKLPVLASEFATHSELKMGAGWTPTSAGFVKIEEGALKTYGESESLKMKPVEDDAEVIEVIVGGGESIIYLYQDTALNLNRLRSMQQKS